MFCCSCYFHFHIVATIARDDNLSVARSSGSEHRFYCDDVLSVQLSPWKPCACIRHLATTYLLGGLKKQQIQLVRSAFSPYYLFCAERATRKLRITFLSNQILFQVRTIKAKK